MTAHIQLAENELKFSAIRASGPGGQYVNSTSSAVQLQFDAANSRSIPPDVFTRLKAEAGRRMSADGIITLRAEGERSQHRNKQTAIERLVALIKAAAIAPTKRRKTRPTKASKERRLTAKNRTAGLKKSRSRVTGDD